MRLKKLLGFVKEYHSTIGSVLVVLILVGVCLFTVIDKKLQKTTEHGRMVQLTPLYKDAPEVPHYYKVAYSTLNIDANVAESGNFRDSVGAFSGNNLTEQQVKAADVNADGIVSVDDAQSILIYYVKNTLSGRTVTWDEMLGRNKPAEELPILTKIRTIFPDEDEPEA